MNCLSGFFVEVKRKIENHCWETLCLLHREIKKYSKKITHCSLLIGERAEVGINSSLAFSSDSYYVEIFFQEEEKKEGEELFFIPAEILLNLPPLVQKMLHLYLPYCFAPLIAKIRKRPFVVSHFAQSLDGHIATKGGDSKWIGNKENLIHAHRMRALCDAVLIGRKTLVHDRPQLTVRHVKGDNPARVILGATLEDLEYLEDDRAAPIYLVGDFSCEKEHITVLPLPKSSLESNLLFILEKLYEEGIYSVYLEGGAQTTSQFLQEELIDTLQLHISPLILGSGIPSFSLAEITQISQGIDFSSHCYESIGNAIMFIGHILRK